MSDTETTSTAQAGQPVKPSFAEAAVGQKDEALPPGVLTQLEGMLARALDERDRKQQSARDKQEARIKKEIDARLTALTEAQVELTPEQRVILERKVRDQLSDQPAEEEPAPAQAQATEQPQSASDIDVLAAEIMQEYGVVLDEQDPEAESLKEKGLTRRQWLKRFEDACATKKERLATTSNPAASTVTIGGGSTPGNHKKEYIDEMLANRGKGMKVAEQIKEKYRKLGVEVDTISLTQQP